MNTLHTIYFHQLPQQRWSFQACLLQLCTIYSNYPRLQWISPALLSILLSMWLWRQHWSRNRRRTRNKRRGREERKELKHYWNATTCLSSRSITRRQCAQMLTWRSAHGVTLKAITINAPIFIETNATTVAIITAAISTTTETTTHESRCFSGDSIGDPLTIQALLYLIHTSRYLGSIY